MTGKDKRKDLILLAADKDMEFALKGVFSQIHSLRIRAIQYEPYIHPEHDPGCWLRGHEFLRPFVGQYKHALVVLDRDGCGQDEEDREVLERELEERLSVSGWGEDAAAIVIQPELEVWVWSDSPEVEQALGWNGKNPGLRQWLEKEGLWTDRSKKPQDPKKAVEQALRKVRKPRSSSIYKNLAENVSFRRCEDPAFEKLCKKLTEWFPA
jgi:hypothetical protein